MVETMRDPKAPPEYSTYTLPLPATPATVG
nr:MAG TPA: hypothetical protein [Caudoviricetes sp.]